MIDFACIFSTGGVILFCKTFCPLKFDAIDILIKKVLIQDKTGETALNADPYIIKWKLANDIGLIFTVVYREMFHVLFIDELLEMMKSEYLASIYPKIVMTNNLYKLVPDYEEGFKNVMQKWELKQQKTQYKQTIMRSFAQTGKGKEMGKSSTRKDVTDTGDDKKKPNEKTPDGNTNDGDDDDANNNKPEGNASPDDETGASVTTDKDKAEKLAEARKKLAERANKGKKKPTKVVEVSPVKDEKPNIPYVKQNTEWLVNEKVDYSKMKTLDRSKTKEGMSDATAEEKYLGNTANDEGIKGKFLNDNEEINLDSSEDEKDTKKTKKGGIFSKFSNSIKSLTGSKVLDEEDLQPILAKFKEDLMIKNVAEQIALKLCDSIKTTLIDKKTKAFTSISQTVKACMVESLTKILTPKRNIEIIAEAMRAKEQGRPYVMVFIGVNGVGKSTNLAKVAYLLKNQGFSILLAACDNFRSGAVEQIKTHGACLKSPVFERGYKDDPANIAYDAIREAAQRKIDCVLIDTAGRMQDNEPLMKALSRLVVVNQPDLIIFVGEALVGNDAVDQLTKFNKALIDLSPKDNIREIDAILLTKFDTVDEKVGAAISMTYATGKPVLFVGTGQKYTHLKKLNINTVVNALLN